MLTLIFCVTLAVTAVAPRVTAWALHLESPDPLDATASPLSDLTEVSGLGKPDAWYVPDQVPVRSCNGCSEHNFPLPPQA